MHKEKYYLIQSEGYPQNEKYKVFPKIGKSV